ncbi:MAG: choice-of-anchor C family protein [Thermoleophilia bacterium]
MDGGLTSDWAPATATAASTARIDRTAPGTPGAAGGSLSWSNAASGNVTAQPGTDTGPAGLLGSYYLNSTLTGPPVLTRTEAVDFNWGGGMPDPLVPYPPFSVRWEGGVTAPSTGTYTFRTLTDDGVRLWIDGQLVIDNWTLHAVTADTAAPVTLVAGRTYPVVMEYYENMGQAEAHLQWQTPGGGGFVAVPQAQLSPLTYEHRESTDGGTTWSAAVAGAQPSVSDQGETLVQFRATDAAGNVSGWGPTAGTAGATVRLDRTAPGGNPTSELVSNGTFEAPAIGSGFQQGNAGQGYGAWSITSGSIDLYATTGGWNPAGGAQSLDMNGVAPGAVTQTLTTVPGTVYRLSFAIAGNPGTAGVKEMAVDWGGSTIRTVRFDTTGHTTTTMGWTTVTLEVTATSTSTALTFQSLTPGAGGVALDNVSVIPQTGPTVTGGSLSWQSAASVTVTGSAATDVFSGVSGYEYRTSTDGGATWGAATPGASAVIGAEGETLVQFRAVDNAGNAGDWLPASPTAASTVRIDRTAATAPTVSGGSLSWQNVSGITFSAGAATGGPSGLGSYSYRTSTDGGTTWGTPVTGGAWGANAWVSAAGQAADTPLVGVDGVGDAVAVWLQYNGSNSLLYTASRPAGGAWGAPTALTATGFDAMTPGLAVAPDGTAVATWSRSDGTQTRFQAAVRSAAGVWGAPTILSAAGSSGLNGVVAIDGAGNAVAAWEQNGIQSARYAGGSWSAPQSVGPSGASQAAVDMNATGDTALVWRRSDGTNMRIEGATRSGAGAWSAVSVLSAAGQDASMPDVAVAPSGDMTAAWSRSDGANTIVQTTERPSGGAWGAGTSRSASGQDAAGVRLAAHADGALVATWSRYDGTAYRVQVLERASGGAWGAVTTLSDPGQNAFAPVVATSANGDAIVTWYRWDGSRYRVQSTVETQGGSWDAITTMSDTGATAYQSQVAMAPDGTAVAVWFYNAGPSRVQSAVRTPDVRATVTAEGQTLVQFRTVDGAGNTSAWSPASATAGSTARIDRTAPSAPAVGGGSLSWLNQASTTVSASGATDSGGSAVSGYEYRTSTDGGTTWGTTTAGASATVGAEGETLVQFRAVDGAGNTSAWTPSAFTAGGTVRLDRTAPTAPSVSGGSLSWQSVAAVAVTASGGTDAGGAALSGYEYRTSTDGGATWTGATAGSSVAITAEGETLVQFRSVDGAANTSGWTPVAGTAGATVRLDRTAPTAPTVGGGPSPGSRWPRSPPAPPAAAIFGGSGLAGYQYRTSTDGGTTWGTATPGASLTVTEQGETLVQYRTVDGAGNTGAWTPGGATNGSTVRIDRTGPGGNAGAELVTNGGFETPAASGPFSQRSADFGGWTLDSGDVDQVATYWAAAAGGQSLDLNGGAPGAISQTLATTPGDTYRITFQVAGNWSCAPAVKEMVVNWDGAALRTVRFDAGATSAVAMGWTQVSLEATATTASTVLQFQSLTAGQCGVTLDEVSVTDQAGPTVTGGSLSWLSQASTTVTASDATDLLSGMDVYEYRTSSDGGATWSPGTSGASAVVTLQGQTLVQFRAVDNAGNSGPWAPATPTAGSTVRLDRTTPSKPSVSGGSLSWRSVASVDVSASGSTDAGGSGLSGYENRTSTDGGATWSAPASGGTVTVGAEGETLVQFRSVDGAGNTSVWTPNAGTAAGTVRIDRTAPGTPAVSGGSLSWQNVASVDVTGSGSTDTGGSALSGYEYRTSTDGGTSWGAPTAGTGVTVSAEGETLVQFRGLDNAGNASAWSPVSAAAGSTVRIDRTDPTAPTVSGGSLAWQSVASIAITASGSTDTGGASLTGYQSRLSTDGGTSWSAPASGATVVVSAEGETQVQFRAVDGAGNVSAWTPVSGTAGATARINRSGPSAPTVSGGSPAWQNVASITLTGGGATSSYGAIAGYEYRLSTDSGTTWGAATSGASVVVGAEGETLVQFRAIDDATNTRPWSASATARIDRGAPTAPTAGGGSLAWQSVATITLGAVGATDAVSGVVSHEYRVSTDGGGSWSAPAAGAMVFVNAEGETLAQFRAVDAAGNVSAWSASGTARIDRTAPTDPTVSGGGPVWQSVASIDVTASGSDGGDSEPGRVRVAHLHRRQRHLERTGHRGHPHRGRGGRDAGGVPRRGRRRQRQRMVDNATVRIDRTGPSAPSVSGGNLSWQSVASVDVTAAGGTDALSGIAGDEYRLSTDGGTTWGAATGGASVTVSAEGETLVQYRALDAAGNAGPGRRPRPPPEARSGSTAPARRRRR